MDINDIIVLDIIDTNENGVGIAKKDNAVIFVNGAVKGDTAEVKILSHEKNYYTAEITRLISLSDYRIKPECGSFYICGGCTLGNVSYEYENIIKKNTVISAFRRAGIDYSIVENTVYSQNRANYRNNISLHFDGEKFVYYASKTNDSVVFDECLLSPKSFYAVVDYANSHVQSLIKYHPREIHVRNNHKGDITLSVYTETAVDKDSADSMRADFQKEFAKNSDITYNVAFICDNHGSSYIYDEIHGLKMRYSSEAFRQVNTETFEMLLDIVLSFASKCTFDFGADLYCGSGIIGLTIAEKMPQKNFIGIEINPDSINDAKYNAAWNGIGNIKYFVGDSSSLYKRVNSDALPEFVIVDPPRAGLSKSLCNDLVKINPSNIIYVSCNPQTLARDLKFLTQNGYKAEHAVPVNLFPFTKHVETVCLLSKQKPDDIIRIGLDLSELDITVSEKKATYGEIQSYVLEHSGLKVSHLYIAQVKQKYGIIERENYNKPKSEDSKQPQCPPEKEAAIAEALKYFKMI